MQLQQQNMDQTLNSPKTPHSSPLRVSYGMSFVKIFGENWSHYNGMKYHKNHAVSLK